MVREASEARADAVWPGETRGGEQAHHAEGDAGARPCRRIDLSGWTAHAAYAHDLISHGVVRRAGGAMDKKVKKKVLQQIPYGAYIVGTQTEDGKDWLMFGTWLMQTSFKPTLVAFAFRKDSRTLANVRRSKSFAVSFIREGTQDVAELVLDGAFEKVKTERTTSGLPVLSDGAGWIECHVVNQIPEGDHVTFDPARAIREHGEAGRGPLRLHFLERPIEHQFGDVLRALSDERDGERLRSSDIREGPAIFAERERDQGRLEGGLHQPRAEHQPVLSVLGLCADDVRAVWNLLEDFLLDFLVHRPTGPP